MLCVAVKPRSTTLQPWYIFGRLWFAACCSAVFPWGCDWCYFMVECLWDALIGHLLQYVCVYSMLYCLAHSVIQCVSLDGLHCCSADWLAFFVAQFCRRAAVGCLYVLQCICIRLWLTASLCCTLFPGSWLVVSVPWAACPGCWVACHFLVGSMPRKAIGCLPLLGSMPGRPCSDPCGWAESPSCSSTRHSGTKTKKVGREIRKPDLGRHSSESDCGKVEQGKCLRINCSIWGGGITCMCKYGHLCLHPTEGHNRNLPGVVTKILCRPR